MLAGDRIGLLGANGAGKSTLLKAIAGTLAPLAGKRHRRKTLAIGYFAQHQVEQLRDDESPLWHLARLDPAAREQEMRDFLGGFDFRGEMVTHPVGRFSGGEKARLALALLVCQRPNLLLLDEPTNHLDIEMREALAEALQDFDGALIVVAHDGTCCARRRMALARRRWRGPAVRRRSRRLPRLGARARPSPRRTG